MSHIHMLHSEQTIYQVQALHQELLALLQQNDAIVLDLSEVREIDSAGLQALLWFLRYATAHGKQASLRHASQQVQHFLALMGPVQLEHPDEP